MRSQGLPKTASKKQRKILQKKSKKYRKSSILGSRGAVNEPAFSTLFRLWAVLGDPGGPDGPQTAPQDPHDPPKPRFFMILDPFWKGFWQFFSYFFLDCCRSCVDESGPQTTQNASPHHAEHLRHGGGDGPQGSCINVSLYMSCALMYSLIN